MLPKIECGGNSRRQLAHEFRTDGVVGDGVVDPHVVAVLHVDAALALVGLTVGSSRPLPAT